MRRPIVLLLLLLLASTQALQARPAEDHWTTEIDPEAAQAFDRAAQRVEAADYAGALPILRRLALDLPANADVFNLLGFTLRQTGELAESGRAYGRALRLNPTHLGALEYQGELFLRLGDLAAAEANLARLQSLCDAPCEESDALAAAIDAWRQSEGPP